MKILITGANGFIGKNLCCRLAEAGYSDLIKIVRESTNEELVEGLKSADFVFHLAGINRPKDEAEFQVGNVDFTRNIIEVLSSKSRKTAIVLSSSSQAESDNAYGTSKSRAESLVSEYAELSGSSAFIYRLPNIFGKWCRPNYNSFVATFCHNIINDIEINIHDRNSPVSLVYIDDICNEFISLLKGDCESGYRKVDVQYDLTVGEVAELLLAFKAGRESLMTERVGTGFCRALYSTYISYYSPDQFSYSIPSYVDERGVFSEMLKTKDSGQFSFFTAHPGVTRGGHYHHSKNEKFLVLKGTALFKFEHIVSGERFQVETSGDGFEVVETVPGWSHDITNIGDEEMVVMLWANEIFDRKLPDTIAKPIK